jgi:hypothetical protein
MAKHINSVEELATAMEPILLGFANDMANEVYVTLNYFLNDYYTGWTPQYYKRTKDFLYSAVKTEARMVRGNAVASVYIDYESMNNYVSVTGFQVATWANEGLHGGLSVSHKPHVWADTIANTVDNGSLLKAAVAYLRYKGFTVRT